uniref:Uncharacterized protein n=1 Tax=Timema genevievae TaxID=629358 RepID=A0A7R9PLR0_TIMGE|nr:unnamed protein product [Timema genevievae]
MNSLKRSNIMKSQDVFTRKAKPAKPHAVTCIFNTLFPLEEINAKRVIVGMSVKINFTPYVQKEKYGGNCAVFNRTEWQELDNYNFTMACSLEDLAFHIPDLYGGIHRLFDNCEPSGYGSLLRGMKAEIIEAGISVFSILLGRIVNLEGIPHPQDPPFVEGTLKSLLFGHLPTGYLNTALFFGFLCDVWDLIDVAVDRRDMWSTPVARYCNDLIDTLVVDVCDESADVVDLKQPTVETHIRNLDLLGATYYTRQVVGLDYYALDCELKTILLTHLRDTVEKRMLLLQGHRTFYHRVVLESGYGATKHIVLVKCVIGASNHTRLHKRNVLPAGFQEPE